MLWPEQFRLGCGFLFLHFVNLKFKYLKYIYIYRRHIGHIAESIYKKLNLVKKKTKKTLQARNSLVVEGFWSQVFVMRK